MPGPTDQAPLPAGWELSATSFNWTPDIIRAERSATELAAAIAADGIASTLEIEAGQVWRGFPTPTTAEIEALRQQIEGHGGRVSMVGVSLDEWQAARSPDAGQVDRRRTDDERLDFLEPQLRAAAHLGATGARLPLGQAGLPLLERVLPLLHELELTLYEEIQGQQRPDASPHAAAIDTIAALDDSRIRLLVDSSMLMPSLPPSYLEHMAAAGLPGDLVEALRDRWTDDATQEAVGAFLRSGGVPGRVHTLYMNLLIRFGRQRAADLRGILPLVGAIHLKFWDLDDSQGRVSAPICELASELARVGFRGTLCSEWGGHDWVEADAGDMTRGHLALARAALAEGAAA